MEDTEWFWALFVFQAALVVIGLECRSALLAIVNEIGLLRSTQDTIASELQELLPGPRHDTDHHF